MKLKELKKTVNVSWSPCDYYPAMLATGSAAQQVDSSFSSTSALELYALNLEDPGLDLELKSSLETQHKFHKIVWSGAGVIVGGCDGGLLEFYSTEKLLKNASDSRLGSSTKHTGHVSALDINPYQKNLLASGASESEIFIWDLNNTAQPMAPGNRSQPQDHVQALAWNQQVQHILGSTFATRCVVWDLRKNEPIMKLSDSQSRTRWRSLAWHPSVATQLCIASEDDQVPVIQLWDLRLAASPLLTMEGHRQGVLGLSWSAADSSLLLSAGKDGNVLCWDPNNTRPGGEVVQEVVRQAQWVFDVQCSPRVPGLLAAASFDQQLGLHCLLAADKPELTSQSQSTIMDSFGGLESFNQLPAVQREPQQEQRTHLQPQPARPPKWLKRPVAAKFGFGGKLVMFEKCPQESGTQKLAYISQVVSEPEIVERAAQLDAVLNSSLSHDPAAAEHLAEYCRQRGDAATDQHERYTWFFLRANFLPNFRAELLNLLGYKQDEIPSKFKSAVTDGAQPDLAALSRGESTETEAELSTDTSTDLSDAHTLIERKLANVDLGPTVNNVVIPNGEDQTSIICRALVCGNLEEAVELCLDAKRIADALIIASLGSQDLLFKVQKYHLKQSANDPVSLVAGSLLQSRWDTLVNSSSPQSWKDVLAALLTHCDGEALSHYCEMLGEKLSSESSPSLSEAASICFLCAMSPEQLVARWAAGGAAGGAARGGRGGTALGGAGGAALAALTETVLLARAAAAVRGRHLQSVAKLEAVLQEYAWRLAGQGRLQAALAALDGTAHCGLRDRLVAALSPTQPQQPGQYNRNRTLSSHSQKRGHLTGQEAANTYNTIPGPYEQKPWQQASVPAANSFSGFPQTQPLQPQPLPSQPPQPLQPQLPQPPTQPPRPGSVGPQTGGLSSRSKYKVDPSVQSAPRYNQYNFNNTQPYGGYNSPLPDQYSTSSVPNPGFAPINSTMNPLNPVNPVNPVNPLNPVAPLNPAQPNQLNSANPLNPVNPLNPSNPSMNGGYYNPSIAPSEPVVPQKPAAPGWNDPPMLSSKTKPKQEVPAQAPITHPLFGVEPPQHVPLTGPQYGQYPGQVPTQQYPGQAPVQQYPGQAPAQQYPGQTFPGQTPAQYQGQSQYPGQYQQQQQFPDQMNQTYQQGRESPAPPAPKAPIPAQHQAMVNVFDALTNECSNRAANPQMKRKLEDVHKRLETLYDMLRENRLSDGALATLQSCASLASSGDFEGASQTATSLAAGAEFASVASFLPGLKVLLQLAAHLQVRLQ